MHKHSTGLAADVCQIKIGNYPAEFQTNALLIKTLLLLSKNFLKTLNSTNLKNIHLYTGIFVFQQIMKLKQELKNAILPPPSTITSFV